MPKKPPPPDDIGPMGTQPLAHGRTAATQMLPLMPAITADENKEKDAKGETQQQPKQKEPPTRAEAVRAAWARITRRASLRKQREAQRG